MVKKYLIISLLYYNLLVDKSYISLILLGLKDCIKLLNILFFWLI